MTTGERIKMVRKSQKLNQSDFAKEIAVSTTTVCQLEVGKYNISRTTKRVLCNRFHVNPEWLETGEGEMYSKDETAEGLVPDLIDVLNGNQSLMRAIRVALDTFELEDWKKINAFVETLGENSNEDNR